MKRTNNFAVEGFVANSEIRQFNTANKAQFSIGIARKEKIEGEDYITKAYIQCEAWRKAENSAELELLKKGAEVKVEGFFDIQSWVGEEGNVKSRLILAVTHISKVEKEQKPQEAVKAEKPEQPAKEKKAPRRKKAEKGA